MAPLVFLLIIMTQQRRPSTNPQHTTKPARFAESFMKQASGISTERVQEITRIRQLAKKPLVGLTVQARTIPHHLIKSRQKTTSFSPKTPTKRVKSEIQTTSVQRTLVNIHQIVYISLQMPTKKSVVFSVVNGCQKSLTNFCIMTNRNN